jgi:hypothetical protein
VLRTVSLVRKVTDDMAKVVVKVTREAVLVVQFVLAL